MCFSHFPVWFFFFFNFFPVLVATSAMNMWLYPDFSWVSTPLGCNCSPIFASSWVFPCFYHQLQSWHLELRLPMQQVAPKSQLWSWTQHNRHRTIWTGWNKEWSKMLNLNLCESWYWWIKDIKWYSLLLIADLYEYLGIFGFGREIMVVREQRRNERNIWYELMRVVWIRWPCWRSQGNGLVCTRGQGPHLYTRPRASSVHAEWFLWMYTFVLTAVYFEHGLYYRCRHV